MIYPLKKSFRKAVNLLGFDISKKRSPNALTSSVPPDFNSFHKSIIDRVKNYTVTSNERLYATIESTRYILKKQIHGSFVECGVYKGGSMMAVALTLLSEGVSDRDLYLFDTFEGMPKPSHKDKDFEGKPASVVFESMKLSDTSSNWVNASLDEVKQAMSSTGYPDEKIHFIKGMVEETLPRYSPESIAWLRLDTDWYESTKHELECLFGNVSSLGVVIIDDYGHFQGAKEAVDEYFTQVKKYPYLHRIDFTGRLIIKTD